MTTSYTEDVTALTVVTLFSFSIIFFYFLTMLQCELILTCEENYTRNGHFIVYQ